MSLTEDQKFECQQAFNYYGNGKLLTLDQLYIAMQSLGILFSIVEKKKMEEEYEQKKDKAYTLQDVENFYLNKAINSNNEEDFLGELKKLDGSGTGKLNFEELEYTLTNFGEKMTKDEIAECFKTLNKDGEVDIQEFAAYLTQK